MDWILKPCLKWFGDLPLKTKLHISFGWLCLFTVVLGMVCLGGVNQISHRRQMTVERATPWGITNSTVSPGVAGDEEDIRILVHRIHGVVLSLLTFIVLLDVVMAWRLTQIICEPILEACEVLNGLARHDLTQSAKVTSTDEVGRMSAALNGTISYLRNVLSNLRVSAEALQRSSDELATETQRTTANCHEQSTLAQSVLSSTSNLVEDGNRIARNSTEAARASRESAQTAGVGGEVMAHAAQTMDDIAKSAETIQEQMTRLDGRSHEISKAVTVIREISESTNLLALNAAIEAARAGEQGRGFAVVAGEVRRLAEHTRSATEEIAEMVRSIQQETVKTTAAVVASRSSIQTGKQSTTEAQAMLNSIIERANRTQVLTGETASAARGQNALCDEIGTHAAQVARLAGASLEASDQAARNGENMRSLAKQLSQMVQQFRL
jgi:methyl-accepting chemotaxis protein